MKFIDNETISIYSDIEPKPCSRTTMPYMTEDEIKDIQKKPFLNKRSVNFYIKYNNKTYNLFIPKGYTWDGASIPFGFRWILGGKGNPSFLIPSMVHDEMCENKHLIDNNRKLSSIIFYNLLLACQCSKLKAKIMYLAVDNYQKLAKGWKKDE